MAKTPALQFTVPRHPKSSWGELVLGMTVTPSGEVFVVGGRGKNFMLHSRDGSRFKTLRMSKANLGGARGLRTVSTFGREIWISGEWGHIARSVDGGRTFKSVKTPTRNCCWSLVHDADGNVWGTADNGWVGYCTDKKSWRPVSRGIPCSDDETWKNTYGMPGGIAWAEPSPLGVLLPAGNRLLIGNEADAVLTGLEAKGKLSNAIVTSNGSLVAVGHDGVYRSTDRGETFQQSDTNAKGRARRHPVLHRIRQLKDVLVVTGDNLVMVSTDDGETFRRVKHPFFSKQKPKEDWLYALGVVNDSLLIGGDGGLLGRIRL